MIKLIPAFFALFIFTSTALAEDLPGRGPGTRDFTGIYGGTGNPSESDSSRQNGYTVFPIEGPKRCERQTNTRNEWPEDTTLMESLRIFTGVGVRANQDCPRQPSDRGLLKDD
jgi:hypothetical protein